MDFTGLFLKIIELVLFLVPIWLPILLWNLFLPMWGEFMRAKNLAAEKFVLLQIRLPKEITKSPLAMELFLLSLNQTSEGNWYMKYIKEGRPKPWFSLEMVSIGGDVRFYIWSPAFWKKHITSHLYSQFSTAEITEVDDYVNNVEYEPGKNNMWGCEFTLTKPDPYPIKTYVDYGLDKETEEENKVDPLTPVLEYLGSLKPEEQAWIQILITGHKKKPDPWKDEAEAEIKKIKEKNMPKDDEKRMPIPLTKGESETIAALERSISKFPFDVGIRAIYIGDKDVFNFINVVGLVGTFKQFSSNDLNGFKPMNTTGFDYPWQDLTGNRTKKLKRNKLRNYKARSYFFEPGNYLCKPFILNSEELATIFHFPGNVAQTPTFERIMSKKGEPPANLPF